MMVPGASHRLRWRRHVHLGLRWLQIESLIDMNLGVWRMIDDDQRELVEEIGLPKIGVDAHIVIAIARHQMFATDFEPFGGLWEVADVLTIDVHAERCAPHEVADKAHFGPIVSEEEWDRNALCRR